MGLLRASAILSVALTILFGAGAAEAAKKKKAKAIQAAIVTVDAGREAGTGSLTIKEKAKKKNNVAAAERKIQVTKTTKVEKIVGKKKDKKTEAASFSDLQGGKQVTVTLRAGTTDQAERIQISAKKKKKQV